MPLRPFPYQLSIGTDIVHVNRVRTILQTDQARAGHLDRFLRRFLTPAERIEFYQTRDSLTENREDASSKHLAGRWAAKEAVIKAVTWRSLSFHDVIIQRSQRGRGVFALILDQTSNKNGAFDLRRLDATPVNDTSKQSEKSLPKPTRSGSSIFKESFADDMSSDAMNEAKLGNEDIGEPAGQIAKISISHDGEYATAVCLAAEEPMDGDVGGEAAARECS